MLNKDGEACEKWLSSVTKFLSKIRHREGVTSPRMVNHFSHQLETQAAHWKKNLNPVVHMRATASS